MPVFSDETSNELFYLNLIALLEGLEVPNPHLWAVQEPPEKLKLLGAAICKQAKKVSE